MNYKDEDPIMNFLRETQEHEFGDSGKNEAYHIGAVFLNEKMDSPLIHGYTHFEVQEEISKLALSMNSAIDEDMLSQLIVLLKRQRCFSKLDKHLVTHFINSLVQYIPGCEDRNINTLIQKCFLYLSDDNDTKSSIFLLCLRIQQEFHSNDDSFMNLFINTNQYEVDATSLQVACNIIDEQFIAENYGFYSNICCNLIQTLTVYDIENTSFQAIIELIVKNSYEPFDIVDIIYHIYHKKIDKIQQSISRRKRTYSRF